MNQDQKAELTAQTWRARRFMGGVAILGSAMTAAMGVRCLYLVVTTQVPPAMIVCPLILLPLAVFILMKAMSLLDRRKSQWR